MARPESGEPVFLQLWFAASSAATLAAEQAVLPLLSGSERERLEQIKSASRRREFLLGRALMRHCLSRRFDRAERDWDITDRARTRPVVTNLPAGSFIGLAHSKGLVCFALGNCELGIDLEFSARQRNFGALAKMFMTAGEKSRLAQLGGDRAEYFYRVWCAKEASYKLLDEDEQADTLFTGIDYARLCRNEPGRYLREGRIGEFAFAAVTRERTESVGCDYFLDTVTELGRLDLFDA